MLMVGRDGYAADSEMRRIDIAHAIIALSVGLLAVVLFAALSLGRYSIPIDQVFSALFALASGHRPTVSQQVLTIVGDVRLPRIVAAVLVGGALSVAGASYQGMFRNPLVSPDLLGVSAGACVGAACAILLHLPGALVGITAMVFGIAAVCITLSLPKLLHSGSNLTLILAGVLVGGLMNSIIGLLKYLADPEEELASIVYWTMGSLASVRWETLNGLIALIVVPALVLIAFSWRINLLAFGDKEAHALGVNVRRLKVLIIICSTLLTSAATCISGTIGWIGLIIPHFVRLIIGENNRFLVPLSFTVGSVFMVLVDTCARTLTASEIPLSIFTGVIAVPVFTVVLALKRPRIS